MIVKSLFSGFAFLLLCVLADASYGQSLNYRGYSVSGTLYGCAYAPSGWGIATHSASWVQGRRAGSLGATFGIVSINPRVYQIQTYPAPPAGSTVTVTVTFENYNPPYNKVTRSFTVTTPSDFPRRGTLFIPPCF